MNKALQELKKLHTLIIHSDTTEMSDADWQRLARTETRRIAKLPAPKENKKLSFVCYKCFGE